MTQKFISLTLLSLLAAACGQANPKSPGLDKMGSPGIAWSAKSYQQRLDFMAGVFHPKTRQLFIDFKKSYAEKGKFTCETCHGEQPELTNYKMPNESLYALPKENTLQESHEYDAEVTDFMQKVLTPRVTDLLNQGEGAKTQASCFSCHPVDE
ncbi:MAG TPA: hypothetical protein VHM70_17880 [Polyangiaceae bacterium]|jgi:cytochrome c553|nr:hypothetical protein [Polyangiaceae bacterium]